MTRNGRITHAGSRGNLLMGAAMALFCVSLLVFQAGCEESASTVRGPVTEPETRISDQNAAPAEPDAEEQAEPVELDVTVLQPRLAIEKTAHDFGEVGPDTRNTTEFTFTNVGEAPLKIVDVNACCGARTRGVAKGQEYAPGESGTLEVDWYAGSHPGSVNRTLYLRTNSPEQSAVALRIQAKVVRRIEHDPQRLRLFLRRENAGAGEITIRSLDGRPFAITGFRSTANALNADFDPDAEATEFVLEPEADMDKLAKNLRGQVSIDLTHPETKNVRILYDVLPEFTVNPPQLMMFNLEPDQPVQREIWVLSNYKDEFEIESAESQKGTIEVVDRKKVQNRYQLSLKITPPAPEGERSVLSDMLDVKIKGGETLSIPFRGFY